MEKYKNSIETDECHESKANQPTRKITSEIKKWLEGKHISNQRFC